MKKKKPVKKKNSKILLEQEIKLILETLRKAVSKKKKPDEEISDKVKEEDKEDIKFAIEYGKSLEQGKLDYEALFSYLGSKKEEVDYEGVVDKKVSDRKGVWSYGGRETFVKTKMVGDMLGGAKEHVDPEDEKQYRLWMQMNPAQWRFEFELTNRFGYRNVFE